MPSQSSVQLLVLMRAINLVDMPESMLLTHLESFIEVARTGNVSRAARLLGVHRNTVLAKLSAWNVQRPAEGRPPGGQSSATSS